MKNKIFIRNTRNVIAVVKCDISDEQPVNIEVIKKWEANSLNKNE